jgi:ACS family allantoate permease-like MFS transporter
VRISFPVIRGPLTSFCRMIEALKTWIIALFSVLVEIELAHQSTPDHRDIFGFTNLQTTLLGRVNGFAWIVAIWTVTTIASWMPDSRAYVGATYFMSPLAAVLMIEFLPWSNQIGLLWWISQCLDLSYHWLG